MLTHLCGAGGIGMPTISLLLLALISVAMEGREARSEGTSRGLGIPDWRWGILAVLNVGLILAWFYTGWQPVTVVQQKQLRGDQLLKRGDPERAEREFLAAGLADLLPAPGAAVRSGIAVVALPAADRICFT